MRSWSIKTYLAFLSGTIIVAIGAIVVFIILPTLGKIEERSQQIAQAKQLLDERKRNNQRDTGDAATTDISASIAPLKQTAIEPNKELAVITELQNLADTFRIQQQLTLTTGKDAHTFTIKNTGSFDNLLRYLEALEHLPYYVIIQGIELQRSFALSAGGDITMQFSAKIYVQQK